MISPLYPHDFTIITSWTNGQKAEVHLLRQEGMQQVIMKAYRRGFERFMIREYLAARYLGSRLAVVPKVIRFQPTSRRLFFSYIEGKRVLEWVLERFGDKDIQLADFQSFHGLNTNPVVASAFERFRASGATEAVRLKEAIRVSYSLLHSTGFLHGSCDPRNLIYDNDKIFIIDFDHARPSINPSRIDYRSLLRWFGIHSDVVHTS